MQSSTSSERTIVNRARALVAVAAVVALSAVAGRPATAQPDAIAPFAYTFRVVGFSMTATLTYAKTSATIRYQLLRPSTPKTLYYYGPHPTNPGAAWKGSFASPIADVAARATYTSPDPTCTGKTIEYKPAGNKIVQVFVQLLPPRRTLQRVSAGVGRIPLATPHPGQDGSQPNNSTEPQPKCGEPHMGDWYQDEVGYAPATRLVNSRITATGHHQERFTDPGIESIDWNLEVTLQRVGYHKLDCATNPAC